MGTVQSALRGTRRATNISISARLLDEARLLQVNISRAAEQGVAQATAERRAQLWLEENQAALESSNEYAERNGLPLARYRSF
ncbi:type II toxin-antitoxin system CcdA family antitoxin [Desulfurivibrio alkaliphilus]|uniref:Post-segregation antitoxin CcdA n=1 Tax=Desulfurivibrio alkaliphilus (strain DSM 19089 / UNIQEM U267 / AHT2) TaxID=589865 RepID=D6Z0A2_DESAT|nr:type II toxin-antitoxin system CcdA family antitoxin [Desulfurivibrio alkaliphilus]ADH87135.1 conserved hypothetical protein [Desulfurivibrio alkaliphilus AHT 2]